MREPGYGARLLMRTLWTALSFGVGAWWGCRASTPPQPPQVVEVAPADAAPTSTPEALPAPEPRPAPEAVVEALTREGCAPAVEALERALRAQRLEADALRVKLYGEPLSWPEDTAEAHTERAYKANLNAAIEEFDLESDLLGLDCAEPPCIAVIRLDKPQDFDAFIDSEAWIKAYGGERATSKRTTVDCGEGPEHFWLLSPSGDVREDLASMSPERLAEIQNEAKAGRESRLKRLDYRWGQMNDAWLCGALRR